jgi:hypothetical protein
MTRWEEVWPAGLAQPIQPEFRSDLMHALIVCVFVIQDKIVPFFSGSLLRSAAQGLPRIRPSRDAGRRGLAPCPGHSWPLQV